jgi:hypothetical protein
MFFFYPAPPATHIGSRAAFVTRAAIDAWNAVLREVRRSRGAFDSGSPTALWLR